MILHGNIIFIPLGTCAGDINRVQAMSSYLVDTKEGQILLDAGSWQLLHNQFIDYTHLKSIFFSHGHFDHTAFLFAICLRLRHVHRQVPVDIYYPVGWNILTWTLRIFHRILGSNCVRLHPLGPKTPRKIKSVSVGSWNVNITWTRVLHSGFTVGYRFDFSHSAEKLALVYSPDTAYLCKLAIKLAQNADYWILDSTFPKTMPRIISPHFRFSHVCPGTFQPCTLRSNVYGCPSRYVYCG